MSFNLCPRTLDTFNVIHSNKGTNYFMMLILNIKIEIHIIDGQDIVYIFF